VSARSHLKNQRKEVFSGQSENFPAGADRFRPQCGGTAILLTNHKNEVNIFYSRLKSKAVMTYRKETE